MKLTNELLAELREKADGATPGPWRVTTDLPSFAICNDPTPTREVPYRIVQTENQFNWKHSAWRGGIDNQHNADFIAAANPTTVVALLDAVETMREALESIASKHLGPGATDPEFWRQAKAHEKRAETLAEDTRVARAALAAVFGEEGKK